MPEHEDCHVEPLRKPVDKEALRTAEVAFMTVSGMGCPNCALRVRNALLSLDDVLQADVHLARGVAAVTYRPERLAGRDLVTAVSAAGNDGRHDYRAAIFQVMPAREAFSFGA